MGEQLKGLGWLLLYVCLSAVADVYLAKILQAQDPRDIMAITFGEAGLFFLIPQLRDLPAWYRLFLKHWRLIVPMNLCSCLAWASFFVALKFLEPAVAAVITYAVGPLVMVFLSKRPSLPAETVASTGIFLGAIFLIAVSTGGQSAVGSVTHANVLIGFAGALLSGATSIGTVHFAKELSERRLPPLRVMSFRFWGVCLMSLIAKPTAPDLIFSNPQLFWEISFIAIATIGLPCYAFQLGLRTTEPITAALVVTLVPLITMGFQSWDPRLSFAPLTIVGVVFCQLFIVYGVWKRLTTSLFEEESFP